MLDLYSYGHNDKQMLMFLSKYVDVQCIYKDILLHPDIYMNAYKSFGVDFHIYSL